MKVKNKTAFIIGTGPSLKDVDVSLLKDYTTITFNRAYIAFEEWGFEPTYYLAIDGNDIRSIYKDINNLILNSNIERFFLYKVNDNEEHTRKESYQDGDIVSSKDMIVDSPKITYIPPNHILPNAGWMGVKTLATLNYNNIAFVGCDCRYIDDTRKYDVDGVKIQLSNNDIIVTGKEYASTADTDVNHFRQDYFGKGIHFGKPNEDIVLELWWHGSKAIKNNDFIATNGNSINITSCTKGSKANKWYEYVPLEDYITATPEEWLSHRRNEVIM